MVAYVRSPLCLGGPDMNRRNVLTGLLAFLTGGPALARTVVTVPPAASMAGCTGAMGVSCPGAVGHVGMVAAGQVRVFVRAGLSGPDDRGMLEFQEWPVPAEYADTLRDSFRQFAEPDDTLRLNGRDYRLIERS